MRVASELSVSTKRSSRVFDGGDQRTIGDFDLQFLTLDHNPC